MMITPGSIVFDAEGHKLEVGEFVGQGGFGAVFKAIGSFEGKILALKTLTIPFSAKSEDFRVFLNEGTHALKIKHENVIEYDFFHDGSKFENLPPYILMEYANGGTLADLLNQARSNGKLFSLDVLIDMFSQLIEGMAAVNDVLVHRDIKPENILISGTKLKISDFGLAKLALEATRKNTFKGFGTLPYIAPEAWVGGKNTILLDIYAMGMVFYELAALRHPFNIKPSDFQGWKDAHLLQSITLPSKFNTSLPPTLSQLILKMVEKSTASRTQNWTTVRELLTTVRRAESISNPLVAGMMKRRIDADTAAKQLKLVEEKKRREEQEFGKLILSQAMDTLVRPLQELFDEFDRQYTNGKFATDLNESNFELIYYIQYPNGNRATVKINVLIESNYWREQEFDDYGQTIRRRVLAVPHVNSRKVQGFGSIQFTGETGFNVLLLENAGELYGEWFMLLNHDNPFSRTRSKPDPFAFSFEEMEDELRYVGVFGHKYHSELKPLDISFIQAFFADAIV